MRASRNMDGYAPTGVFARVKNLEMSQDRIAASVDRCNRDLSRVSTRVRATRRELSPSLRKVEARSDEQAQYSAAMERRLAHLGDEVKAAQETMMALTDMTAKQFSALSFAVKELKEAEARAQAEARAPVPVPAPVPPPAPAPVPVTPAPKPAGAPDPNGEGRRRERNGGNRAKPTTAAEAGAQALVRRGLARRRGARRAGVGRVLPHGQGDGQGRCRDGDAADER